MKMVRIVQKKNYIVIDTEKNLKAFGFNLLCRKIKFKKVKKNGWKKLPAEKPATKKEHRILEFWLHNHRKYVVRPLMSKT